MSTNQQNSKRDKLPSIPDIGKLFNDIKKEDWEMNKKPKYVTRLVKFMVEAEELSKEDLNRLCDRVFKNEVSFIKTPSGLIDFYMADFKKKLDVKDKTFLKELAVAMKCTTYSKDTANDLKHRITNTLKKIIEDQSTRNTDPKKEENKKLLKRKPEPSTEQKEAKISKTDNNSKWVKLHGKVRVLQRKLKDEPWLILINKRLNQTHIQASKRKEFFESWCMFKYALLFQIENDAFLIRTTEDLRGIKNSELLKIEAICHVISEIASECYGKKYETPKEEEVLELIKKNKWEEEERRIKNEMSPANIRSYWEATYHTFSKLVIGASDEIETQFKKIKDRTDNAVWEELYEIIRSIAVSASALGRSIKYFKDRIKELSKM
jgi:predicted HicB family RNase H-like nuclease